MLAYNSLAVPDTLQAEKGMVQDVQLAIRQLGIHAARAGHGLSLLISHRKEVRRGFSRVYIFNAGGPQIDTKQFGCETKG